MTSKEKYEDLKNRKICVYCKHRAADEGFCTCEICRSKQRKAQKERREWLKANGFCPQCGSEKIYGDEKICSECAAKKYSYNLEHKKKMDASYYINRRNEYKEKGICTKCRKRKAQEGKTMCPTCLIAHRNRMQRYRGHIRRSERDGYGLCYICGKGATHGKLCEECAIRSTKNLGEHSIENDVFRKLNELHFKMREVTG